MSSKIILKETDTYGPNCNITSGDALIFVNNHPGFQSWLAKTESEFGDEFKSVKILDIYPFGPAKTAKAGFITLDADIQRIIPGEERPRRIPGFALIRGAAVAILVLVRDIATNKMNVVLTVQPRVPGGSAAYTEIPAGMLTPGVGFTGTAAKEVSEETGLTIKEEDLIDLGYMDPSMGGCDETIQLFYAIKDMPFSSINDLEGKCTGVIEEGETITLRVIPLETFKEELRDGKINDAKALAAWSRLTLRRGSSF